jgi:hypothetical protein
MRYHTTFRIRIHFMRIQIRIHPKISVLVRIQLEYELGSRAIRNKVPEKQDQNMISFNY